MRAHLRLLVGHFGERHGVNLFRRHPSWYLKGFPIGSFLRDRFSRVDDVAELDSLLDQLDPTVPYPEAANQMVRGHSNGPQAVRLPHGFLDSRQATVLVREAELVISGG